MVSLSGGGGETDIWTNAVSGDGSVVVGSFGFAGGFEAFRWTAGVGFVELGNGWATGVSADGSVIVGQSNSASGHEAVRWTTGNGMQRLWDLLLAQGVDPAAGGWSSLTEATAVSADGNTIVGYGTRNGNTEAFAAVVREPLGLRGDYNQDGVVDAADFNQWTGDFGTNDDSDADHDGDSDGADFLAWQQQFGRGPANPPAYPVPEPASHALAVALAIAFFIFASKSSSL
jgi:uncharacterized membrane protein